MEKYDILTAPDEKGFAKYRRARDGKCAIAKTSWFKKSPDGEGAFVPRSRTKAIRIRYSIEWN